MLYYWIIFQLLIISIPLQANEKVSSLTTQNCIGCHAEQASQWRKSDHAKAMAIADEYSVLANFNNVSVEHYGQKAFFFIQNNRHHVTITYDNNTDTYPIKYTFGHFPLQQYLVETEHGKLQVLPFAWDSRAKKEEGQRWYHNYSHEEIRPEDRLHWRQPLQNWNGMCADCHSDGLIRHYDSENNRFNTQFDNINVGCLSCHGKMPEHEKKQNSATKKARSTVSKPVGLWLREIGDKTAHWQGVKRDNRFMDTCFSCHALRSPLTDGFKPHKPFLEQFTPQLPSSPNYYPDGQIKEEVYVYGSFLQSKMFKAGVNCLDCHDKHTMKLKVDGNGLCLQCHSNEVFNVKTHHQHQENSTGAQCVNCHMPDSRFMGVDDRRDHSFKIPRPDLSLQYNTPNACVKCHTNQTNQWASENLNKWHGQPKLLSTNNKYLIALNSGEAISLKQHLSIVSDENIAVIHRASALSLLPFSTQSISIDNLKPYLTHQEALLRLSATQVSSLLSPNEREQHVAPLLKDTLKAIRVAAARSLLSREISPVNQSFFERALNELFVANETSNWRGEGRVNQAILALEVNDILGAEKLLKEAIEIEPYFDAGYINLADLYRSQQRTVLVNSVLKKGLENVPLSGGINYSFGLHLVRQKKLSQAVDYFNKAMQLTADNAQYAYTYVLALDGLGQSQLSIDKLKQLIMGYQDKMQLKELGLYLSQKLNSRADYEWFMRL
ncbi:cytochrome c3 family protein [Colwellia sp. 1_MG-2023]|uniref:multiheme c-type cytochrome n=1 Tax=Colwellia sp. 1_MG-2023 TaxID=3062649 RepID=UPI0026E3B0E3|nr:multiheme c-type cytochrome [Colwellia sp. 1_MG-2023]MDO6444154.1 cytochrome c3 family protein [Colwellia sp. 1_MG-2023]